VYAIITHKHTNEFLLIAQFVATNKAIYYELPVYNIVLGIAN